MYLQNMVDSPSPVVSPSSSPTSVLERVRMLAMCEGVEGDEAEGRSRTRIYTELMETEHTYVSDLSMVIDVSTHTGHCEDCFNSLHRLTDRLMPLC